MISNMYMTMGPPRIASHDEQASRSEVQGTYTLRSSDVESWSMQLQRDGHPEASVLSLLKHLQHYLPREFLKHSFKRLLMREHCILMPPRCTLCV